MAQGIGIVYNTSMEPFRVVLDTNVIFSGLYSDEGASYQVIMELGRGNVRPCVSVPLFLEYEQTLIDRLPELAQTKEEIYDILDYVCSVAIRQSIFYLWRPFLRDPKDDMILELAVAADARCIVTFNKRHFRGVDRFGIEPKNPSEFLEDLRRRA